MFRYVFVLLCLSVGAIPALAQPGCMDPQAINYNPAASSNDGSCQYATLNYSLFLKDSLPPALSEISGMVYWNGKLYVHGDSGSPTKLFETDTLSGTITKEIFLQGISHVDWEDITQDSTHFYIGDIGNNAGNRTNLRIYKFPKNAIGPNFYDTIAANEIQAIQFSYPDQTDFSANLNNTRFDCEALAYRNGKLHLFTKNWLPGPCVHYTLPTTAGTFVALRLDSLDTQGTLITAADFAANQQLMLLGYKNSGTAECALWYVYDFSAGDSVFVTGNKRKIGVGDALLVGQIEGVCFADTSGGFASSERFNPIAQVNIAQKLYRFGTQAWFPYQLSSASSIPPQTSFSMQAFALGQQIQLRLELSRNESLTLTLYQHNGRKLREKNLQLATGTQIVRLDEVQLSAGVYYVLLQNQQGERALAKVLVP